MKSDIEIAMEAALEPIKDVIKDQRPSRWKTDPGNSH